MKAEDLSLIKRYPIVEYLERKGINPVRRTSSYVMYRSPLRAETHPSFKVDIQKNLWIDYTEGRGGSIIDLCMRLEGCTLSEAICRLGQTAFLDAAYGHSKEKSDIGTSPVTPWHPSGARRLIEVSDSLPPHLEAYLTDNRCIDLNRAKPFLKCISYEVRGQRYQAIGFANPSGGYELRDNGTFKGAIAPKDITPVFTDKQTEHAIDNTLPVCVFEGFMDFLSFLSMKEEITSVCLVLNSVSNVARAIRYLNDHNLTHIRTFLDNDEAGRRATNDFIRTGFNVEDMSVYYRNFKDLNEYHVYRVREKQIRQGQIQDTSIKAKQVKHKMR